MYITYVKNDKSLFLPYKLVQFAIAQIEPVDFRRLLPASHWSLLVSVILFY